MWAWRTRWEVSCPHDPLSDGNKTRVEEWEFVTSTDFVEDLIHAGDREPPKNYEFVRFLVVDRDADATGHTRDDHILGWRMAMCGVE